MSLPPELRNYYTDKFELAGDERLELALSRFALVNLDEFDRYNKLHNAILKNLVQLGTMQARRPYVAEAGGMWCFFVCAAAKRLTRTLFLLFLCPYVLRVSGRFHNSQTNILTSSFFVPLNGAY